ncbi:MAG TPA: Nramp family divalent metal transporter [Planctomycetota bacterium]
MSDDFQLPTKNHPAPEIRELPEAPVKTWGIIGPGLVSSGVGLASGEFILWPFIASQVGLVFLWGAVLGVVIQWFLNLEIERYTLATGETALTGFSRMWKHWGLVFVVLVIFANAWPGWATSSATLLSFMTGGNVTAIAVTMLVATGAILTLAPVVYVALERLITVKVIAIGGFFVLALIFALKSSSWGALPSAVTHVGRIPNLDFALMMGAIAFAGAGGGQNLCQSNWIRDKGFGMGRHIQRLVSPVTGKEEALPTARACVFALTDESLGRWRRWWRFVNVEQALTFVLVTALTIMLTSMLAHSTLFGNPALKNDISFLRLEGDQLKSAVGGWFGSLFWIIGSYSLFAATVGIIDYTARLAADVVKWTYLRESKLSESRLYFFTVWGIVAMGSSILLFGIRQPLVLLVISACTGGMMMFVYSLLLILLNRRTLPDKLKTPAWRVVALLLSAAFFAYLSYFAVKQGVEKVRESKRRPAAFQTLFQAEAQARLLREGEVAVRDRG